MVSTTTRKVLVLLYGTLFMLLVALLAWLHNAQMAGLKQDTWSKLGGVTGTLASQVDGSRITRLLETYDSRGMLIKNTQDAWYYVLHESLRRSATVAGLEAPLRILAYDPFKRELQVVVTSDEQPELRAPYTGDPAGLVTTYLGSRSTTTERTVVRNTIATFSPVIDADAQVVGVVIAEHPLAELVAAARQRLWRNIAAMVVVFSAIGFFLFRRVGRLVERDTEAFSDLQRRHHDVTDSIAYAGKIQGAVIPRPELYRELFDDFFLINRPKDVVSGDFNWYHRISDHECFVAAADCTGHGLPGAMMATIGCSLLNELVMQHPHIGPAELLARLNARMIATLHQSEKHRGNGDGMDIGLCRVDRRRREILFAGAFRPLYWMNNGKLNIINGDRKPIGGNHHDPQREFTEHRLAYHEGDRIYLFSDGYVDQLGGPDRRRFMTRRLNEVMVANERLPMSLQAEALERAFLEWKGDNEQVDDICVLGIAV